MMSKRYGTNYSGIPIDFGYTTCPEGKKVMSSSPRQCENFTCGVKYLITMVYSDIDPHIRRDILLYALLDEKYIIDNLDKKYINTLPNYINKKINKNKLSNESDPEKKRKIIGNAFIDIFNLEAKKLKNINFLAQGTIYPDVIESAGVASGKAKVIKSHHNVGGLPEDLQFDLVEPLKELFKDEVREIGLKLGLPKKMLYRHPFPGPGLGVRILGPIKEEFAEILRKADHIFMEELNNQKLYDKVDQAFAVFLPVKSVGVAGDERRYDYVIALRAVETIDFMTASWARLPYEFLDHVSNRIMNEISRVSRVVYDISGKPPSTIEWE